MAAPHARAGPGDLTFASCLRDADSPPAGCVPAGGLNGPQAFAASADSESLCVVASGSPSLPNGPTLAVLDCDRTTGTIRFASCFGRDEPCNNLPGLDGTGGVLDVAVSKDNTSVYMGTGSGDSIVAFNRNTTTGALTFNGCVRDARVPRNGCTTAPALEFPAGLDLSDDGKFLYTATLQDSGIVWLNRNTATGRIDLTAACRMQIHRL